ncbi:MAG: sigma-70 family RNA polymerase sigma factor [Selenomonas sp.]|nr:sigma-70 family RNA polymerase sigma factor [Selenomonas sp.]
MYNLQEENELIALAQKGSKNACEKLLATYEGLFKNMSRRYAYTPTGKTLADDMVGILHLAFMEAIRDFEPAHGTNFAAFLQSRLHGAVYKAFKHACSYSQHTAHPIIANREDCPDYFDTLENHQPLPENQILAQDELRRILHNLTSAEKRLLHLIYVQELPQIKAARILHITPQAISKRKQNLIAKLKKLA